MRKHALDDHQHLLVTGWLNSFPLLKAAYDLKERYYNIWNMETAEEALAEYLRWQDCVFHAQLDRDSTETWTVIP